MCRIVWALCDRGVHSIARCGGCRWLLAGRMSTTEQRATVPIAHSGTQHGQGSQSRRIHESIVRARAADRRRPRCQARGRDTSLENSHAVHHRRHFVDRVATRDRRNLYDWRVRPRAISGCDRALRRWAGQRATRLGIAAPIEISRPSDVGLGRRVCSKAAQRAKLVQSGAASARGRSNLVIDDRAAHTIAPS